MRPLVIDDSAKAAVARVKAYAEANHYYPSPGQPIPGDNPNYVVNLSTYRTVFTYTHAGGVVYRDLSVSVPSTKLPNPAAVFAIADMFGFTGYNPSNPTKPGEDWFFDCNETIGYVRCAQPVSVDASIPLH
jgi:hypothetical protein